MTEQLIYALLEILTYVLILGMLHYLYNKIKLVKLKKKQTNLSDEKFIEWIISIYNIIIERPHNSTIPNNRNYSINHHMNRLGQRANKNNGINGYSTTTKTTDSHGNKIVLNGHNFHPSKNTHITKDFLSRICHKITRCLNTRDINTVFFNHALDERYDVSFSKDTHNYETCIQLFKISVLSQLKQSKISLKNINIIELHIELQPQHHLNLSLTNCSIGKLVVNSNKQTKFYSSIKDSHIHVLSLDESSVDNLNISNTLINTFITTPPDKGNPFKGSVYFNNNRLDYCGSTPFYTHAQSFRNITHHLLEIKNFPMANIFTERLYYSDRLTESSRVTKIFSLFYEIFSKFGTSIGRPILILAIMYLFGVAIIYYSNGVVAALDDNYYKGWRSILIDEGHPGRLSRAFAYASYPITNPFNILSSKALLVAIRGEILLWSIIQSIFSYLCIVLTIFAVRRRFKMNM